MIKSHSKKLFIFFSVISLLACAATAQHAPGFRFLLTRENPEARYEFELDIQKGAELESLIVEVDATAHKANSEYHFEVTLDCKSCGGIILEKRFATFPLGEKGRFIFQIPQQSPRHGSVRHINAKIALKGVAASGISGNLSIKRSPEQ